MRSLMFTTVLCLLVSSVVAADKPNDWKPLFDGKSLEGWSVPVYGGDGEVTVKTATAKAVENGEKGKDGEIGEIVIGMGVSITGIRRSIFEPKLNYEIRYEAMRPTWGDFFATVTFPVGDAHCSFVAGGWGGSTIGISSIDGMDASENSTTGYYKFNDGAWYTFRVRVTEKHLDVWITGPTGAKNEVSEKHVVDLDLTDHTLSMRMETRQFRPLGFCTYSTTGHLRKIEYRMLTKSDTESDTE